MSRFDPLYWLSEKLHWPGSLGVPRGLSKEHNGALWEVNIDPPIPHPEIQPTETGLQEIDEQRWTAGRGYESRIVFVWLAGKPTKPTNQKAN
jgi:hypothetical protein